MKAQAAFAVFLISNIFLVQCVPLLEEDIDNEGNLLIRVKRITCDLLSFSYAGLSINHAACAAHCLLRGKPGGRCINTICKCRRELENAPQEKAENNAEQAAKAA